MARRIHNILTPIADIVTVNFEVSGYSSSSRAAAVQADTKCAESYGQLGNSHKRHAEIFVSI
jgi:hypothetical protein